MPADAALRALIAVGAAAVLSGCGGSGAASQAAPWPTGPWPAVVKGYFMEACESSGLDPRTVDAYCACALGVQMRRHPKQNPATAYEPGDDAAMHPAARPDLQVQLSGEGILKHLAPLIRRTVRTCSRPRKG